jgi:hypothetical protein
MKYGKNSSPFLMFLLAWKVTFARVSESEMRKKKSHIGSGRRDY